MSGILIGGIQSMEYENTELYDYLEQQRNQLETIEEKEKLRVIYSISKELDIDETVIQDLFSFYHCKTLKETINILKRDFIKDNMRGDVLVLPPILENEFCKISYCRSKNTYNVTYDNKGITNFFRLDNDDLEIDTVIVKRRKSIQGKYTKDRKNIETNEKKSDDPLEGQMSIEDVLEESNEENVTTNIDEKEFQEAEFENESVNKVNVGVTSAFNNLLNRNKSNGGVY